jgi:hypothetical protein
VGEPIREARIEDDREPVLRIGDAAFEREADGVCIQLLAARIQNAESVVPPATATPENTCSQRGTRSPPNKSTERNVASRKKAVKTS